MLEAVRQRATDEILDEVHRYAHEAERLGERRAMVLGEDFATRPTDTEYPSRGYGLAVELRVLHVCFAYYWECACSG